MASTTNQNPKTKALRAVTDAFIGKIPNSTLRKNYQVKKKILVLDFRPKSSATRPTKYPGVS